MADEGMTNDRALIAHRNEDGEIQPLTSHLVGTARYARDFAAEFGCGDAGEFCGLLHDIGKGSEASQKRMYDPEHHPRVDHSTAGAKEALNISQENLPAAVAIAAHHSGLMDVGSPRVAEEGTFFGRMKSSIPDYSRWKTDVYPGLRLKEEKVTPAFSDVFGIGFFTRMLYSCLVDADYLDTEGFMRRNIQRGGYCTKEELAEKFQSHIAKWTEKAEDLRKVQSEGVEISEADRLCISRTDILQECMEKGKELPRGLYTLTVPTGGGKTTASMGFALNHICSREMKRIIYVIPYTSIIDQNAEVFEDILGNENVVEHHSGVLYDLTEGEDGEIQRRKALATENWDAPVIVTTAVQFFESLFGNRSSVCRKLHNLANSVIIFDEAQTLPIPYLKPCVASMAELVKNYRSTVVLCTATQPALGQMFQKYLPQTEMQEICGHTQDLFAQFERVTLENRGVLSLAELEKLLRGQRQVLCVVNTRRTAQKLYQDLKGEGVYCLTTLLCPVTRKRKIAEIKKRLSEGKECVVIATSLIEAGVNLDFYQVYRQEVGLDSLIQAAGRCNRNGERTAGESMVYSFRLEGEENRFQAQSVAAMRETWRRYEKVNSPEAITFYFSYLRSLLGEENLDQKGIMKALDGKSNLLPFKTVAERFKLIENSMRTVYIPVDGTKDLLKQVAEGTADRNTFRRLGQYAVNVYEQHFAALWEHGCLEEISRNVFVLRDMNQYNEDTGLQMEVETGFGYMA